MGKKDRRVDDYIARSATFAKPILRHLRRRITSVSQLPGDRVLLGALSHSGSAGPGVESNR